MARKTQLITIAAEGRDKGKTFVVHEMPSDQGERWFFRLVLALANAGAKVPDQVLFGGAAGFAEMLPTFRNSLAVAIRALQGLSYDGDVEMLLNEMLPYIKWQPPGGAPEQDIFPGPDSQIEEVSTRFRLRVAWAELHVGFSLADVVSTTESDLPSEAATA